MKKVLPRLAKGTINSSSGNQRGLGIPRHVADEKNIPTNVPQQPQFVPFILELFMRIDFDTVTFYSRTLKFIFIDT